MRELLLGSLASSTRRAYAREFEKCKNFCIHHLKCCHWFPLSVSSLGAYIAYMYNNNAAPSTITCGVSALSFFHKVFELKDNANAYLIQKLLHGARKNRPSTDPRAPITLSMLHQLVSSTTADSAYELLLQRAMFTLAFFGFLRLSEMARSGRDNKHILQFRDIVLHEQKLVVTFRSFKHHKGPPFKLDISAQKHGACPVSNMSRYFKERGTSPGPLFILPGRLPVTRAMFNNWLTQALQASGTSSDLIKPHSFRIGAVCHGFSKGIPEDKLRLMGRWKSAHGIKRYIRITSLQV